jgi:hypothetical protein
MITDHLFLCNSQMSTKNVFSHAARDVFRKRNKLFMIEIHSLRGEILDFSIGDRKQLIIENSLDIAFELNGGLRDL